MSFDPEPSNAFTRDVWGTRRAVEPHSLFSGLFTYGISPDQWRVSTPTGDAAATSVDGGLLLDAGTADGAKIRVESRRHPRYQPNRGHNYATAWQSLPSSGAIVRWGLGTAHYGIYFEWVADEAQLYLVLRNTTGVTPPGSEDHAEGAGGTTTTTPAAVTLPSEIDDLTVNRLADIRFQWRGSGDLFGYVDQRLVHAIERLGLASGISIAVPSLPAFYEIENVGGAANPQASFGCVDVSSDGGEKPEPDARVRVFTVSSAGVGSTETALLAIRAMDWLYGIENLHDAWLGGVDVKADTDAVFRVYMNPTSVTVTGDTWTPWSTTPGRSGLAYAVRGGNLTGFTATDAHLVARLDVEATTSPSERREFLASAVEHLLSPGGTGFEGLGDVLLITAEKATGGSTTAEAIVEINEEV